MFPSQHLKNINTHILSYIHSEKYINLQICSGFFTLAAVLIFAIAGARAQCPNNGVGVGMTQLCNIGTPKGGSYCNDLDGFITTPGTWNEAAVKINLSLPKDMCGNGYTHGAFTTCDGSGNVISVNPPGAGAIKCTKQSEVAKGSSSLGAAAIYYCCN